MKRKFRADEKAIITVKVEEKKSQLRGILSSFPAFETLKRRGSKPIVTFYDLAQVNTGTVDSPVWSDHPIIYSPNYTVQYYTGISGLARQQNYNCDPLDTPAYNTYYNCFFQFPVTDWKHKFRQIKRWDGTGDASEDFYLLGWLLGISEMSKSYSPYPSIPTFTNLLNVSTDDKTTADGYKNTVGFAWTSKGLELAKNTVLHSQNGWWLPNPQLSTYFSTSGGQYYKITEEYDPFAPEVILDVGDFRGNIDVYLFPQLIWWWAFTTDHLGYNGQRYLLGFNWQILPRQYFPNYVEPFWAQSGLVSAPRTDPNSRKADFLTYQKSRSGQRASVMVVTTPNNLSPASGTESPMSPSSWPIDYYLSNCFTSGATPGDGFGMIQPGINMPKVNPSEQLMGVFKINGKFYYTWYMSNNAGLVGFTGFNTSDGQSDSKYFGLQMWP